MNEKNRLLALVMAVAALVALPGCELVEGIFKAGMWTALILIGVAVLAIFGVTRMLKGRSSRTSIS